MSKGDSCEGFRDYKGEKAILPAVARSVLGKASILFLSYLPITFSWKVQTGKRMEDKR